ncbi:hypothetical protein SCHPADRAFT_303803 [Schizopora paradoxa]|uniref:Uncharacterized protein n=1 Tax=Schizopora paradoxa TaxID=27342 RepID=A0A0H2RRW9_9AGAM|nr:hypothetical protein SCHPADRAFT_303803 [Schizopora paradoxa]
MNQSAVVPPVKTTANTTLASSPPQSSKKSSSLSSGLASGLVSAVVVFLLIFAALLLCRRRRLRSKGMVRIGSGNLENGSYGFDIDGPTPSFAKAIPDKPKPAPILPPLPSFRQSFAAGIRRQISSWYNSRHRDSSANYITAWNPRAAVHVVQLPPVSTSSSAHHSSGTHSRRDPERSRRRRHRKHKREREQREELRLQRVAEALQSRSAVAVPDESNATSSSSRRRRRRRRERERDANSSTSNSSSGRLSGRLRSFRNSRIVKAARNLHLAKPGSSTGGSTYAPTMSGLTSEISERPTMTLSPISEVPPPVPPMPQASSSRTLLIANQT